MIVRPKIIQHRCNSLKNNDIAFKEKIITIKKRKKTREDLISNFKEKCPYSYEAIVSKMKTRDIVVHKQAISYLLNCAGMSPGKIGLFLNLHRTTVLYSIRKVVQWMEGKGYNYELEILKKYE